MSFTYNIIICLYYVGVVIAGMFSNKVRTMRKGEKATFSYLKQNMDSSARYIWFHAASLGEFEQGRPIIEELRSKYPDYKILLTFFSPSGYEVQKNYQGADLICYLPIDTPYLAKKFLNTIMPDMAFFIKYEFWYNYLHILHRNDIPAYSVSSIFREGQIFFRWYGKGYAEVLQYFTHFYVQNEKSCQLLETLGIRNATIVGDTRFDRVIQIRQKAKKLPLIEQFIGDSEKVLVAGSTWEGDEAVLIPYFNNHRDCKLIIAPHVVTEEHIARIMSQCQVKVLRYTELENSQSNSKFISDANILIVDCYGLLSSIYNYGIVTHVGGGFDPTGVHNVLEAAVWDCPVIYGPDYTDYQEAIGLHDSGGGLVVRDAKEFNTILDKLFTDSNYLADTSTKSGAYVKSQQGATQKILSDIFTNGKKV
ncbi:MAG: glycosyltransferase N-terminal domain-containing protein [Prevotellaceae bacterium]|nr:glycosyltransferase N-terminal domain-containing protein [Prevotellaceae bacterium]